MRDDVACGARAIGGVWIALNCNMKWQKERGCEEGTEEEEVVVVEKKVR